MTSQSSRSLCWLLFEPVSRVCSRAATPQLNGATYVNLAVPSRNPDGCVAACDCQELMPLCRQHRSWTAAPRSAFFCWSPTTLCANQTSAACTSPPREPTSGSG